MSETIEYLFTNKQTANNVVVFRSTVNSFGLDHVTDKDLFSFYTEFSKKAHLDTGLLPVDGTGLLSIRSALNHTQVAYQHAPGKYYINWGSFEGDVNAVKYLVAQPYRIVIIDFLDNNILGARTFYSPYPITHPNAQLYHVNLPNINCRGYRGNGVGWICLYHKEDISQYPFNERLIKALERCSGVEAYNDQNMSETDGTRFYQEFRADKPYLYKPVKWEEKTEKDGVDWTLDEDLWIPVLVQDYDNQGSHDDEGKPLTFVDALFGNYQAYYYDKLKPKPVNAIARTDLELDYNQLLSAFKQAYMASTSTTFQRINAFDLSVKVKENISTAVVAQPAFTNDFEDNDEEDEIQLTTIACNFCGTEDEYDAENEEFPEHFFLDESGIISCESCFDEYYVELPGVGHVSVNSKHFNTYKKKFFEAEHTCFRNPKHKFTFAANEYPVSFLTNHLNYIDNFNELYFEYLHDKNYQQFFKTGLLKFTYDIEQVKLFINYIVNDIDSTEILAPYYKMVYLKNYIELSEPVDDIIVNIKIQSMCGQCFGEMFVPDKNTPAEMLSGFTKFAEQYLNISTALEDIVTNSVDESGMAFTQQVKDLVASGDIVIDFQVHPKSIF